MLRNIVSLVRAAEDEIDALRHAITMRLIGPALTLWDDEDYALARDIIAGANPTPTERLK